jgi:hypothetical protein
VPTQPGGTEMIKRRLPEALVPGLDQTRTVGLPPDLAQRLIP